MPITSETAASIAGLFLQAEHDVSPIAPIHPNYPELGEEEAYAIQRELLAQKAAAGVEFAGYKAGATNPTAQANFGLSQAVYARLISAGQLESGSTRTMSTLIHPRLECEVAFRMAQDLAGPGVTPEGALAATEGAIAAFELVDSRTAGWGAKMLEMISDNVFAAGFVLSDTVVPTAGLDLANLQLTLHKNGQQIAQAKGANVLGSPAIALAWLANRLAEHGQSLKAGDIVLAGSLTPLIPISAGDTFEATFEHLGSISLSFE